MQFGLRTLQATALMRDYRAQDMAFEIVDMNLDERGRFRRLLSDSLSPAGPVADDRSATSSEAPEPTGIASLR